MSSNKHAVIGTAGHVDHGKTALVKALTGIDTDRLAEEKKRGITIEAGFAHLELPGGITAGLVDVPGHERFIKNMLAGSGGIDLALLVIAADDGIMPQTREHLNILNLLNIKTGLVALSKCDLAGPDWLELVKDDIKRLTEGTFLENRPVVEVSALTGQGLDELRRSLAGVINELSQPKPAAAFRLPLDRVFTLTGFGTVATGTLLEGRIKSGETVMIYPEELEAKVRGLQVHSQPAEAAWPGQRAAVNLNIKKDRVSRGDVLATPGSLKPSQMLDVRLEVLPSSPFAVKNGSLVHLYLGAREVLAKVVLMEAEEVAEGGSAFAQLRLLEKAAARAGDRFVIRFYSPLITIGGGQVLDAVPLKHRRHKPRVLEEFEIKESGSPLARLELAVSERPGAFAGLAELVVRAGLDPARVRNDLNLLVQKGLIIPLTRDVPLHRREFEELKRKLKELLKVWHQNNPFSPGLSQEEIRSRLWPGAAQGLSEAFFTLLETEKAVARELGSVRLPSFTPQVNEAENEMIDKLAGLYLSFGLNLPALSAVEPPVTAEAERRRGAALASLVRRGELRRLDDTYYIHKSHYDQAWAKFRTMSAAGEAVVVGRFRDELGCSRKVAVALLEYFDKTGLTRAVGEGRLPR